MRQTQQPASDIAMPIRPQSSRERLLNKMRSAFGAQVCAALEDETVSDIMLNPDGVLFVERIGQGARRLGTLDAHAAEVIVGSIAHTLNTEADISHPIISGELPIGRHRFEGLLPPVVSAPSFSIRRHASRLIPLNDYVQAAVMTERQAETIRAGIKDRLNIVVSGGTGSGKTTLANTLIAEIVEACPGDRIVIIEDTPEIRCPATNCISLRTTEAIDMATLLKSTLRLRPDRIMVGEVRDGAALTLLKAWNTGHPGGVTTIHANDGSQALSRLEQLVAEVSQRDLQPVIGEAVNMVVSMEHGPFGRRVTSVMRITGYKGGQYQIPSCIQFGEARNAA